MYLQETVDLRARVAKQTSENADEYDIKNTVMIQSNPIHYTLQICYSIQTKTH